MIDVSALRRNYAAGGLDESELPEHPMDLFEKWLKQTIDSGIYDPNGVVVSTGDENGQPYSRMVLLKQLMLLGVAHRQSPIQDLKYFHSRPRGSQLGAWASHQSHLISARGVLEGKYLEMKEKFKNGEIPLPSFWGGYKVKFNKVEFWQGRENRLHDRFIYELKDGVWQAPVRLAP
mgnify:CR=1 FL=1